MKNYIDYYKTIAIEPAGVFITRKGNINPLWQQIVIDLIENNFKVIMWSNQGKEFCEQFKIDNKVEIREKSENVEDVYFCLDVNKDFALHFPRAGVIPYLSERNNKFGELEKIIKLYKQMVQLIDNNINLKFKGYTGYEKSN